MSARSVGLLIAGGRGERLALGVPKALAVLAGRTLLARAHAVLREVCDEVRVVAPAALALPLPDSERIADRLPGEGPLAALVTGLAAFPGRGAVVLGVDLPFVGARALRAIAGAIGDAPACVPCPGGRPQPLAAVFAAAALAPLAARLAAGERALVRAVGELGARELDDDALARLGLEPGTFENLNTPADFAAAERRLAPGGHDAWTAN